jgi:hypothetical protein
MHVVDLHDLPGGKPLSPEIVEDSDSILGFLVNPVFPLPYAMQVVAETRGLQWLNSAAVVVPGKTVPARPLLEVQPCVIL